MLKTLENARGPWDEPVKIQIHLLHANTDPTRTVSEGVISRDQMALPLRAGCA
jgi:hypothetical protein